MVKTVVLAKLYKNYFVDTSKITRGVHKLLEYLDTFITISIEWVKGFEHTVIFFSQNTTYEIVALCSNNPYPMIGTVNYYIISEVSCIDGTSRHPL